MFALRNNHFRSPNFLSVPSAALLALVLFQSFQGRPAHAQDAKSPLVREEGPSPSTSYSENELEKLTPKARPEDVSSPEAVIKALHASVSGPQGEWDADRLRSLCVPNVLLTYPDKVKTGETRIETVTLDELVRTLKLLHRQNPWHEMAYDVKVQKIFRKDARTTIALVTHHTVEGVKPTSIHEAQAMEDQKISTSMLVFLKNRWWLVSDMW
jgi:hypothetical protein